MPKTKRAALHLRASTDGHPKPNAWRLKPSRHSAA